MRLPAAALCLAALPAWADPCRTVHDPAAIALEDALAAEVEATRDRYAEAELYWSPDFAFNAMVRVEATEAGREAARSVARALPRIDAALGLAEAGPAMARGGAPQITIRLLDTATKVPHEAWGWCEGRACTVELFPAFWRTADPDTLAFTLAHEMFHVVQGLAYPAVDHCNAYWWVEGTAEWFANLAVPGQDLTARAGFLHGWDRDSSTHRLIDLSYEAVAFWFWAGERFGPQFPLSLGRFGDAGLKDVAQISTLLPPEDWADLVKIYLGGALAHPDGRPALPAPDLGADLAPEGGAVSVSGPLMSVQRQGLILGPGLWRIRREAASPGTVVLIGDETGTGWTELSENGAETTRFFGCGDGGTITVAAAGGTLHGTNAMLTAEPEEGGCESCLAGVWQQQVDRVPDAETQALYADRARVAALPQGFGIFPRAGVADAMDFTARYEWPGPRLTLAPSGSYTWNDPVTARHEGDGDGDFASVEVRLRFSAEIGRWRDLAGHLVFAKDGARGRGSAVIATSVFSSIELIDEPRGGPVHLLPQGFRATCSGDRLVLEHPVTPSVETTRIFDRVD